MSLNGLDAPAVQEAYQTAIAEPGGWFLLKYVNRDSVELLGRGKSGVHETRNAIAQYEEASPLYGLIIYRRRRVLIKYMPEGTSRLLKARTAVHLQAVQERYTPYDTMLEITTADGLNDTALAASFPLHTASTSTYPKLHEISEDGEAIDGGQLSKNPLVQMKSNTGSERYKKERRAEPVMRLDVRPEPTKDTTPSIQVNGQTSPPTSPLASPNKTSVTQFLVRDDSGKRSITSFGTPSGSSVTEYASSEGSTKGTESVPSSTTEQPAVTSPRSPPRQPSSSTKVLPNPPVIPASPPRRMDDSLDSQRSSPEVRVPTGFQKRLERRQEAQLDLQPIEQTSPPERVGLSRGQSSIDTDDPYDLKKFDHLFKPKVKLGPRPVAAPERTKRSQVASVAAVPANFRPPAKKEQTSRSTTQTIPPALTMTPVPRSNTIESTSTTNMAKSLPVPPPIPDTPEYNPRPLSRGSIKSLPSHKSTAMTPDKLRLMKAVELRKKQLRKSATAAQMKSFGLDSDVPDVPTRQEQPSNAVLDDEQPKLVLLEAPTKKMEQLASSKADSGIEMGYEKMSKPDDGDTGVGRVEEPRPSVEETGATPQISQIPTSLDEESTDREQTPKAEASRVPLEETVAVPLDTQDQATSGASEIGNQLEEKTAEAEPAPSADGSIPIPTIVGPTGFEGESEPANYDSDEEVNPDLENSAFSLDLILPEHNLKPQNSDLARRRRGFVEPLHLDAEDSVSSDDEFMDELHTATLQQAKPMAMSKSPVLAHFTRRPSNSAVSDLSPETRQPLSSPDRLPVSPLDTSTAAEDRASPELIRPGSSPTTDRTDPLSGFRRNVSSGISKRIQALADMSSRESISQYSSPQPSSLEPSPHVFMQRDRVEQPDSRDSSRPAALRSRTSSYQRAARLSARLSSAQPQPSTGSTQSGAHTPVWTVQQDAVGNRNPVSVSARIIRPTASTNTTSNDFSPSSPSPLEGDLLASPLIINQTRAAAPASSDQIPSPTRLNSIPKSPDRPARSDSTISVSPILSRPSAEAVKPLHSTSGNSFGRHKPGLSMTSASASVSPTPDDFPAPPASTPYYPPEENVAAPPAQKETSRTSRFFKRMSNIGGSKRKSTVPHSLSIDSTRQPPSVTSSKERADMPPPIVLGDLNVQFPDTLLWKRRVLEIDDTGHLNFYLAPQTLDRHPSRSPAPPAKRYNLADFRSSPYVPDLDRQELPFSVLLEFPDGSTLQVACEDGGAHRQVLRVLVTYWKAWSVA